MLNGNDDKYDNHNDINSGNDNIILVIFINMKMC